MDRFSCICSNRARLGFCAEIQILFLVQFMFARKLLHCGKKRANSCVLYVFLADFWHVRWKIGPQGGGGGENSDIRVR